MDGYKYIVMNTCLRTYTMFARLILVLGGLHRNVVSSRVFLSELYIFVISRFGSLADSQVRDCYMMIVQVRTSDPFLEAS